MKIEPFKFYHWIEKNSTKNIESIIFVIYVDRLSNANADECSIVELEGTRLNQVQTYHLYHEKNKNSFYYREYDIKEIDPKDYCGQLLDIIFAKEKSNVFFTIANTWRRK